MATEVTRFESPVLVGGRTNVFLAGFVSALVAGAISATGLWTDRSQTTTPQLRLGTGSYLTYTDTLCTNTGGLSNSRSCYIPPSTLFAGTGSYFRVQLDMNKSPNASKSTCVTTPVGNVYGTGVTLWKYVGTFSGSTIVNSTGSVAILPGQGMRCWFSTKPGVEVRAQLRVWATQQYIP